MKKLRAVSILFLLVFDKDTYMKENWSEKKFMLNYNFKGTEGPRKE